MDTFSRIEKEKRIREKNINNRLIKDRIIGDIRTLFEQQQEDYYYKLVRNFWNNNYTEYESNVDTKLITR